MSFSPHSLALIAATHAWMRPSTIAGHTTLRHKRYSPSVTIAAPQRGHWVGGSFGTPRRSTTSSTYGMTSFLRETSTSSPTPMPSARTFAALWSDARCTVAPASSIGATMATGVMRPLGPVSHATATTCVIFAGEANLNAIAPRGRWFTSPSVAWSSRSSTYTTSPSIS